MTTVTNDHTKRKGQLIINKSEIFKIIRTLFVQCKHEWMTTTQSPSKTTVWPMESLPQWLFGSTTAVFRLQQISLAKLSPVQSYNSSEKSQRTFRSGPVDNIYSSGNTSSNEQFVGQRPLSSSMRRDTDEEWDWWTTWEQCASLGCHLSQPMLPAATLCHPHSRTDTTDTPHRHMRTDTTPTIIASGV